MYTKSECKSFCAESSLWPDTRSSNSGHHSVRTSNSPIGGIRHIAHCNHNKSNNLLNIFHTKIVPYLSSDASLSADDVIDRFPDVEQSPSRLPSVSTLTPFSTIFLRKFMLKSMSPLEFNYILSEIVEPNNYRTRFNQQLRTSEQNE